MIEPIVGRAAKLLAHFLVEVVLKTGGPLDLDRAPKLLIGIING